jgi:DNA helicase-2/ATP-dependent DNA helicase PcrA
MFVREIPEEMIEGNLPRIRKREEMSDSSYTSSWNRSPGGFGGTGYRKPYAPTPRKDVEPSKKPFAAVKGIGSLSKGSSMANAAVDYTVGDRVRHIKFGEGIVKNMENRDGATYVTVEFDKAGVRVLSAAFAKLVKI